MLLAGACAAGKSPEAALGGGGAAVTSSSGGGVDSVYGSGGAGGVDIGLGGGAPSTEDDPQTCAEAAARKSYIGCDFWPTVTANMVDEIFDYAVVVANVGQETAEVTVTRAGAFVAAAEAPPGGLATLYLPWVARLKGPYRVDRCNESFDGDLDSVYAAGGAYHLTSTRPVAVYQFNPIEYAGRGGPPGKDWQSCQSVICDGMEEPCFSYSNDASLLFPSTAMTGNYRVTAYSINRRGAPGSIFTVTGTEDGTDVTVKLSSTAQLTAAGGIPATGPGGSFNFSVDAGDVVELVGASGADLSGSLVTATRPVQVLGANRCATVPADVLACDHLEESVVPVETLGRHYIVTVPTSPSGQPIGHVVYLYGNVDGTTLSYPSGRPPGAPATLGAGEVVSLGIVQSNFEVIGDHEFAVNSYLLGAELVDPGVSLGVEKGDPSQTFIVAVEQYRQKYVFLAPPDYDESYVDIIQPPGATILLDGEEVLDTFRRISADFGVVRVKLGPGNAGAHVLTATLPVGIQVLGYGSYTSYNYPGGLNLKLIAPPPR
ncbi:hypothetical protein SOCE26_003560 [Sorangium cellulosum]|uniref:IgGFc-binding protein N-terminal domain-containing protein n=1 Tax=Sorangium cellulosum TaxID=56 RepID=A0A2L0EI54_SORCE|nr:IgGFc-binding protein [Sorangium cellulosum]AUX38974.1 hypothetical protein SOCE26_003560 [Sorangium cellulosum]